MKYRFGSKPFEHQRRGLIRLWKQGSGALFWEPGTGKTKTALDYAAALHIDEKVDRVLILCPINAMQVWPNQMDIHLPFSGALVWECTTPQGTIAEKAEQILDEVEIVPGSVLHFVILNYDAITKRDQKWKIMKAIEKFDPDLLILDESQKVKNATAKRSKAAHRVGQRARFVCLLSGTPVSKNYLDLYSQLKVISPNIWHGKPGSRDMSWTRFRNRYGIWGGRTGYELQGYQAVDDLQNRYRPWISTARKEDCLDLPPVTDEIVPIIMNPQARVAYDSMSQDGMVVWKRHLIDAPIVLTKLLRLQQMTGGAVHDETGDVVEFQMDKMKVLTSLIDDLREADQKVIVFARFKWEMDYLWSVGQVDYQIRGGVSANKRKTIVEDFRASKKPVVLLIQIASGEALDGLQDVCSHAIFYSTDYSWENYTQARGRLDRSGQTTPVTFYHLHMVSTIDKLVMQALMEKKNLEKLVMDDPELLVVDKATAVY